VVLAFPLMLALLSRPLPFDLLPFSATCAGGAYSGACGGYPGGGGYSGDG